MDKSNSMNTNTDNRSLRTNYPVAKENKYVTFFKFGVSALENVTNKLTCNGKKIGDNRTIYSRTIKFIALRVCFFIARIINTVLFHKHSDVTIYKKPKIKFIPENKPKNYDIISVNISDKLLINDLQSKNNEYCFQDENRQIFSDKKISIDDIRQNDNRSSCYFLSMLISYASNENMKDFIYREIVTDIGNNQVKVTFINEEYQLKFEVVVEKNKLITKDNSFVYSSNESSDASWASLMEKAFHGLRVFLKNSMTDNYFTKEMGLSDETIYEIKCFITNDMIGSSKKHKNSLDYSNSKFSAVFLPKVPKFEPIEGLKQVEHVQHYSIEKNKDNSKIHEKQFETIFENAKLGIPMNVNSKSKMNIFKKMRCGFQGIPSSHAMAVVGAASKKNSKGEQTDGLLLFDPYASPFPSKKSLNYIENGTDTPIDIKNAASCLKFIPLKDLHKYFEECVIAAGGVELNK